MLISPSTGTKSSNPLRALRELKAMGITGPWEALRSARNFARTVWEPTRSDIGQGITALASGAVHTFDASEVERLAAEMPALVSLWEEGYDPPLDVDRLLALPEETLGHQYARLIHDNSLNPLGELLALGPKANVFDYLLRRAYKLHDVMHVVLGCDVSVLGEVRIVSYSVGQSKHESERAASIALAVLLLHLALRRPKDFKEAIRLSEEWMRLGQRSKPHVTFRLEDLMERPVSDVREMVLAA